MKVLAMNSSGDRTSISVLLDDEINSFTMSHERKERPNWDMFLDYVGHNQTFTLKEIDLFAFGNNQNSYTATRTIASYLKGLAIALERPLMSIDCTSDDIESDDIAMIAKEKYTKADYRKDLFDPAQANPSYKEDLKFKKIHE
jgi:tRNA A37 threonylcarbamoyltransferase TsaD